MIALPISQILGPNLKVYLQQSIQWPRTFLHNGRNTLQMRIYYSFVGFHPTTTKTKINKMRPKPKDVSLEEFKCA